MPQATAALSAEWDGPSEFKAMNYLHGRGFTLTRDWQWIRPPNIEVTDKDLRAISFLIQEWDFGGLLP